MSWILTRKETGEVIGEFDSRKDVARFDPSKVLVETAGEYLGRINAEIAERFSLSRQPAPTKRPLWKPEVEGAKQLLLLERMDDHPDQTCFKEMEDGPSGHDTSRSSE